MSPPAELLSEIASTLSVPATTALSIIRHAEQLYVGKMTARFSELRISERIKRTNPFLLYIRGVATVQQWAALQVQSVLFASEEEAVGHLLEAIAKLCFPNARPPRTPDDLDFEVDAGAEVLGFQIKMSWDCMPMSSRKNLSATVRRLTDEYAEENKRFVGIFAPCYGRALTSKAPGQDYVSMRSREFWTRVGNGDADFDIKVGIVCGKLCASFRATVEATLVPQLVAQLTAAAQPIFGGDSGVLDYAKVFRAVNR